MARIEISIEEYNAYRNTIDNLEKRVNDLNKELQINNKGVEYLKECVEELEEQSVYDRIFNWKKIIKPLKDVFKNSEEQEKNGTE